MGLNLLVILNEKKINKYLVFDDNNNNINNKREWIL
jgi:hypothetical protein